MKKLASWLVDLRARYVAQRAANTPWIVRASWRVNDWADRIREVGQK